MIKLSHRVRKNTPARHLQALRLVRTRRIVRTIPGSTSLRLAERWKHYAVVATGQLGRRRLARVVWPWQPGPASAKAATKQLISRARRMHLRSLRESGDRVPRGRLSNPTALR